MLNRLPSDGSTRLPPSMFPLVDICEPLATLSGPSIGELAFKAGAKLVGLSTTPAKLCCEWADDVVGKSCSENTGGGRKLKLCAGGESMFILDDGTLDDKNR